MSRPQTLALSLCGLLSLATAMGFSRFSYTALLPLMMQDHQEIPLRLWSVLGSSHHLGYLAGLVLSCVIPRSLAKIPVIFAANAVNAMLLLALSLADGYAVWIGARIAAGLLSGLVFMLTTRLIAYEVRKQDPQQLAIVYAGVGVGIAVSALLCYVSETADTGWRLVGATGFALAMACVLIHRWGAGHSSIAHPEQAAQGGGQPARAVAAAMALLFVAYAIEGFSYIITSTFVVASTQKAMHLNASGASLFWLVFGLFCAPSTIVWGAVQKWAGTLPTLACGYFVQAIGTAMAASSNLWDLLIACGLLGATFMGITSITLSAVAELTGSPQRIAFWITLVYSLGQFLGPVWIAIHARSISEMSSAYEAIAQLILLAGLLVAGSYHLVIRKQRKEGFINAVR